MQVHMQPQQQRSLDSSEFTIRVEDLHCGPMVGGLDWLKRLFKGADIASLLPGHNRNQHMNSEERRNMRRAKSANHAADLKVRHVFPLAVDRNPASVSFREPPSFRAPPPAFRITGMHLW
ncbi:hypothetical protein Mapa_005289 [Marchantia paleacea]|nr:hypothetical protein Mapa_005289 [Marchantia paleacea]